MNAKPAARDIMQRDIVTVAPTETLRDAMALMIENHVSGLPVLDHHDRCIGVVSATDILGLEQQQAERADEEFERTVGSYYDPDTQKWEHLRVAGTVDELPDVAVAEVMTRDVTSVQPTTPVRQVAAVMDERRIHRVLVLDEERRLHGLISALDIVRLYASGK